MDLKEEYLLGDAVNSHWYYRAKLAALLDITHDLNCRRVLDIGAGSGYFSRALLSRTAAESGTCVDLGYPADRTEQVAGKPLHFSCGIPASDADLVLMMDVIEHVEDDLAMVGDYVGKVTTGTHFIVTVPAFMWLWSGHDVFLEHYRRYTLPQLESVLARAGLTVERGHYFYGGVLPLVAGVRVGKRLRRTVETPGSDMRVYGPLLNSLLYGVSRAEVAVMRANRLGGTTVFARAVKH